MTQFTNSGEMYEIFSVPVYKVELNLDVNAIIKSCLNVYKTGTNRKISNLGGFQTGLNIKEHGKFLKQLTKDVEKHATIFASEFINYNPQKVESLWLNINKYKDSNLSHLHTGCDLSGCFYLKTPENCGAIVFQHPAIDLLSFYDDTKNIEYRNSWNSLSWEFEPKENWLYLFPAWLKHYVKPNENKNQDRISIAMNLKA